MYIEVVAGDDLDNSNSLFSIENTDGSLGGMSSLPSLFSTRFTSLKSGVSGRHHDHQGAGGASTMSHTRLDNGNNAPVILEGPIEAQLKARPDFQDYGQKKNNNPHTTDGDFPIDC